jgi:nicotinamide phosphoribosyltransferase
MILDTITRKGYSADNLAFGMGGALLQRMDRDTQKFAMKCSAIVVDGEVRPVRKNPITDPGKNSKSGVLITTCVDGVWGYSTIGSLDEPLEVDAVMRPVYWCGKWGWTSKHESLQEIRSRLGW